MKQFVISDRLSVMLGDITKFAGDAIVNAANTRLSGGGGVDGAIHLAAGPELMKACQAIGGCPTGQAVITPGFLLPARHVIHTVGPIWRGGKAGEEGLLASCYRNSVRLAAENGLGAVAFSAISTGVYGFPIDRAGEIAVQTLRECLSIGVWTGEAVLIAFNQPVFESYQKAAHQ